MRDSVLLYRNQIEALLALPPDALKESLYAIARYAMDDVEPEASGIAHAMLSMCRPLIDANNKKAKAKTLEQTGKTLEETGKTLEETGTKGEINKGEINKGETRKEINTLSGKPATVYPYAEIVSYLNAKTGKKFEDKSKDTRKHIKARIDEGRTLEDFYKVIDIMCSRWGGDPEMDTYLRPATLFGPKMESYLNSKPAQPKASKNSFNNFPQRQYDFDELEKQLLLAN